MSMSKLPRAPSTNQLLAALPKTQYQRLVPHLEEVALSFGEVLYDPGDQIRYVYFPNEGVVSLLSYGLGRASLEIGIVGNEGMVGHPVMLDVNRSSHRLIVQGEGTAMRLKVRQLHAEIKQGGSLARLIGRYINALLI